MFRSKPTVANCRVSEKMRFLSKPTVWREGEEGEQLVTMVTMGGDLQPGCLADRLLTGLGQPHINL